MVTGLMEMIYGMCVLCMFVYVLSTIIQFEFKSKFTRKSLNQVQHAKHSTNEMAFFGTITQKMEIREKNKTKCYVTCNRCQFWNTNSVRPISRRRDECRFLFQRISSWKFNSNFPISIRMGTRKDWRTFCLNLNLFISTFHVISCIVCL